MSQVYDLTGNTVKADSFIANVGLVLDATGVEVAVAAKTEIAALVALTNSTAATSNDTVENVPAATAAVTDTTAASLTSTNAAITAIENDISDLTAKVNAIIAALKA